ncbi:hypothetical protein SDC9_122495 [bioreactor metagenome]|uniref:Uncharacterized protein n=1 Tax=bioreactor metagenome TaxID=1076179 RepID=A0A645CF71_9ZZZZ
MGTPAAPAWFMASTVWGITLSSAAIMMMATSVTLAPRARIAVNASWPGVSRNVIFLPSGNFTLYAPMCWVIPPASPSITLVLRILSSSDVLPWSTCPITVTIGGRGNKSSGLSSSSAMASITSALTNLVLYPNSSATILMVSASKRWLMATITPRFMHVAITLVTGTSIMFAKSFAVTNSVSCNILLSRSCFLISSRCRCETASRFSRRYLAPPFPPRFSVNRASVSFICF